MRDEAVEFRAQGGARGGIGDALRVRAEADFAREIVKLRRRANQLRRPRDNRRERGVFLRQARDGKLIDIEHVQVGGHSARGTIINDEMFKHRRLSTQ